MRIGIVTGEYPPMQGGVGAFSRVLGRTFAGLGHDVVIITRHEGTQADGEITLNNKINRWNLSSLLTIRQIVSDHQLDVLNLQFQTAAFDMSPFIHFLPWVANIPVAATFHDLRVPYLFPKAGRLRDWIVRYLAQTSAGVIVTNHEDLLRVNSLRHHALIPIGSNILGYPEISDSAFWREKIGACENDFLVGYFGFINHSKGVDILLHSIAQIRAMGIPVKLILIGGRTGASDLTNRAYGTEIDQLIEKLGLISEVRWTGFLDDEFVTTYLNMVDVVALPFRDGVSYRRGSLMAAIQHRCAIVSTEPIVDVPTFVDGENMRLVVRNDAEALTTALCQLYQDNALREHLRQGTSALRKHFSWDMIARETISFYESILGARQ